MKADKKPSGIRHKIRPDKKRRKRIGAAALIGVIFAILLINSILNQPSTSQPVGSNFQPEAAIVGQLSLTFPNQTFIQTVTAILEQAGYSVDYYPGENVTVEFYRNLPEHGYKIVILREHSALGSNLARPLALFTSEPYSTAKYVYEQLADQFVKVVYDANDSNSPAYFGVWPEFITNSMKGRFQKSVIFLMGCNGLTYNDTAKAFVDRGAEACIGWFGPVQASHTDEATANLLQHLLVEKRELKESVQETFQEVGPDPAYDSLLIYYPADAGQQTIENIGKS